MSPKSTSSRSSSRTANTSTKNRASSRSRARKELMKSHVNAAWEGISTHERSSTRAPDVGAHRGCDHAGLSDGLHADGPWNVLRLHRVLCPDAALFRQSG